MATRVVAVALLVIAALVAWLTVTVPLAARALQVAVGVSMLYVAWLAWRGGRVMARAFVHGRSGAAVPTGLARDLPFVSMVLPARNEASVIGRAVRDLAMQRYEGPDGTPAFELLVVDDASEDATAEVARAAAEGHDNVMVRRRGPDSGLRTKGAVLSFAMPFLRGDVIGVVDADTSVSPAYLERVMRALDRDETAAALQTARHPRNEDVSWLTEGQAIEQLMDMASQCGRWATGGTAELRGNGMFVRRDALEAAGGWSEGALTEDLELSTRLSAGGRHVALAPDIPVHEEAVETIAALWRQRLRWAEGSMRRLLEHGPALLTGSQPLGRKADFLAFAGEFLVPPLFATTILASLITIPLPQPADWTVPVSLFVAYGVGVFILAVAGLSASGRRGPRMVLRAAGGALFLSHWLLVVPMALLRIAFGPERGTFVQTPRFTAGRDR